jgi:hypothetical protein
VESTPESDAAALRLHAFIEFSIASMTTTRGGRRG